MTKEGQTSTPEERARYVLRRFEENRSEARTRIANLVVKQKIKDGRLEGPPSESGDYSRTMALTPLVQEQVASLGDELQLQADLGIDPKEVFRDLKEMGFIPYGRTQEHAEANEKELQAVMSEDTHLSADTNEEGNFTVRQVLDRVLLQFLLKD